MLKLLPLNINSFLVIDVVSMIIRYGDIIFSQNKNPVAVFIEGLESGLAKGIIAVLDDEVIGVSVFYDFQYFSGDKFICYMYGCAKRGVTQYLEISFEKIFESLKLQGCLAVRFETKKYNLPMRFFARRLGFRKVGAFVCGNITADKICENLVYEKVL